MPGGGVQLQADTSLVRRAAQSAMPPLNLGAAHLQLVVNFGGEGGRLTLAPVGLVETLLLEQTLIVIV